MKMHPNRGRGERVAATESVLPTFLILREHWRSVFLPGVFTLLLAAWLCPGQAKASTTDVIYSFAGEDDGEYTDTDLDIDAAGNLYGTAVLGGKFGGGTVWQLTLSGSGWVHTVLYADSDAEWRMGVQDHLLF